MASSSRSSSSPEVTPRTLRSPMGPLPPLEYLQTHRRGSITDPQLHAAPRPQSPHIRNLLRSPSLDPLPPPRSANGLPIDYNMRRHSIATPHPHGIKRKISDDRHVFAPVGEESDHLVGPGIPSVSLDSDDAPAPKRRGSAIDTQRIAQLSLNDRRGSTDSRSNLPWWSNNQRRDSTSSMLSNPSSTGYSSGYAGGDSPHARLPASIAAFSWPNAETNGHENTIPPLNYSPDRRMSVPDTLISQPKSLRPRSRPPSRQGPPNPEPTTRSSSGQDNPNSSKKEATATPYSRSPELRVSHKLAERKRRKEMKDLFDELRDQLPADRGMKASKWEILTKAIDFVVQLKQSNQDMMREIERLRQDLDIARGGAPSFSSPNPAHGVYGQPPVLPSQGPPPPLLQHPLPPPSQLPLPRPPTQNIYPSVTSSPNGTGGRHRADPPP